MEAIILQNRINELGYILSLQGKEIESFHKKASEDIVFAVKNPVFVQYFELPETKSGDKYDSDGVLHTPKQKEIKYLVDQWIYNFQNKFIVDETCLIDRTGQEHRRLVLGQIASDKDLSPVEYKTPFFKPSFETPKDGVHLQFPYVSPYTHRWVFAYTAPIVLPDGMTPAFYHFEMPLAMVQNMITESAPQGIRIFIVDPHGFLVADSQTDFLTRNQTSSSFARVNSAQDYFPSVNSISSEPSFSNIITGAFGSSNESSINTGTGHDYGEYFSALDGQVHYVVTEPLTSFGWNIVADIPHSQILQFSSTSLSTKTDSFSNLKNTVYTIAAIITVIGIVLVYLLSARITKPLMRLANACRMQRIGHLERIANIHTKDEIASVVDAINNLVDKTGQKDKEIEKTNEQLRKREVELKMANENLLQTERAQEEFMSMVSHELQMPLSPMKIYSEMFLKSSSSFGNINEKQRKAINVIHNNILRLEVLVSDILDVYKLDIGRLRLKKIDVDIERLVNQHILELKPLTKDKQIELKANIKTSGTIKCDPQRINQVISNLVKNSIDFVQEQSARINIRVEEDFRTGKDGNYENNSQSNDTSDGECHILFTVEDNGIGIPPDNIDNLFKKFYQIDTTLTRKHGGTGLGLAISKCIIEAHRGKIWIDKN